MQTERRIIYEDELNEEGYKTGNLIEKVVHIRKEGNYEVIINKPIYEQMLEYLWELKITENSYKKLSFEFGINEEVAKIMINNFIEGRYIENFID